MKAIANHNINMTIEDLTLLRTKIELNVAKKEDYNKFEAYLLSLGFTEDEIWQDFKAFDIYSYEQYILERRKPRQQRKRGVNGYLLGLLLGYFDPIIIYKQEGLLP